MDTHTCLTCDNQTTGDQCIICNPKGYLSDKLAQLDEKAIYSSNTITSSQSFNSEFIKEFGSLTAGNFKLRYEILNLLSNHARVAKNHKLARLVLWLQTREGK